MDFLGQSAMATSVTDDIPAVIADAFDEAERRDPDHCWTWIVLVDDKNAQIEAVTAETASRGITRRDVRPDMQVVGPSCPWAPKD
jgi:hypothetical protein